MEKVLTVAGSDSGGGAGVQADLKTFSALGAYGATVITAITAQNTQRVESVFVLPVEEVCAQYKAVMRDIDIDAMKFGMLAHAEMIEALVACVDWKAPPVMVLDTVMVATSGRTLLDRSAVEVFKKQLLPRVSVVTPNLAEASVLLGESIATTESEMREQGRRLLDLGCQAVVMKGGHLPGERCVDWLFDASGEYAFPAERIVTRNGHGTGCTLSAALTVLRLRYENWSQTMAAAKAYLHQALLGADALHVGCGRGPVHHFHRWW